MEYEKVRRNKFSRACLLAYRGGTATTSQGYFFGAAWIHIPMQHTIVVNVAKY